MQNFPETHYRTLFSALSGASALVLPDQPAFTVAAVTEEFSTFAGAVPDDMIGESLFRYFPDNPEAPNVSNDIRRSLGICISEKRRSELHAQRYDIEQIDGTFREMYWTVIHTPVFSASGEIDYIIHTAVDVTDKITSGAKDEKIRSLEAAYNVFRQTTVAIHIFKGPELIIDLANKPTLEMWGRDESVVGKPLREALPELKSQKYISIIDNVRRTGKPYLEHEAPVMLNRNGREEVAYFNFVLQPYYESHDQRPAGVIAMANEITDILRDRKALHEKERSLEMAVEVGALGIFNIDLESNLFSYSPQIMQWFGVSKLNLPLEEVLKNVHEDDMEMVYSVFTVTDNQQNDSRRGVIFRVYDADTRELQYLRLMWQIQQENGRAVTLSGIIQDITESVESRFEIEQSAQRLRSVIENAPFPIGVYIGREMRIEMVNQSILDAWGRDTRVIGKTFSEVLPELKNQGPFEQLDKVYTTGEPFHAYHQKIEIEVDGNLQPYYFNYSFTPLFDAVGNIYGVMNTAADVTDLILAKQKAEQSEKNFRNIILQAPVAMGLMIGREQRIEIINDSMLSVWGKTSEEVIGRPLWEVVPVKSDTLGELLDTVFMTGKSLAIDELMLEITRNGVTETIYQNLVYEPYRDGTGAVVGVLAISVDVTHQVTGRHKIEEIVKTRTRELQIANERLQASNSELEQFAYVASHDLQEPLRKISLFTQMLEGSLGEVNEKSAYQMERIQNAVSRMMNLIRDILGYSQLSRKNEVFSKTDLNEIAAESLADFDMIIEEKDARIEFGSLPVIDAIPLQMAQLFTNLVSNSLKYSKPGVAPVIGITSRQLPDEDVQALGLPAKNGGYCEIRFSDNGIGFPQEYAGRIFNIFQRLHGKTQYEGTGIGLAMCKKIADNHHGLLSAKSAEGEGATFIAIFPVSQG